MAFNFKLLFRLAYRTLFTTRGTNARLTPKRIFVILLLARSLRRGGDNQLARFSSGQHSVPGLPEQANP